MATRTASNASELATALGASSAGDIIELQTGNFGSLTITNTFSDPGITIRPATDNTPTISKVNCSGAAWITFEDLSFIHTAVTDGSQDGPVKVTNGGANIIFNRCVARGPAQANYLGGYAVEFASGTDNCQFKNGFLGQYRIGYICIGSSNSYFGYNLFYDVGEDAIKGFGNNFTVEYNKFPERYIGGPDDHSDGIQCRNSVTGGYIGHNIMVGSNSGIQCIFFGGDGVTFTDIIIEENVCIGQLNNGISMKSGNSSSGITIRNNTVGFLRQANKKATYVSWAGATVQKCVEMRNVSPGPGIWNGAGVVLALEEDTPDTTYGVNNYYASIRRDNGYQLVFSDFVPVGGSLVDPATHGADTWGAHETIASWITNEQWPPTGAPPPPPEPEPGPAPNVPVVSGRTILLAASGLPLIG